eukprot:CAMPEP_0194047318 /NCGR_PEP_ID=MMETSP0009_2-20130614/23963_1 /TAXON_ID=210454 /ORGANISM="Grammatophora oceanica, Strain CCMP 410" /LENGTH=530 /DNA_ID=CAMNT_0038692893 /DNA_START=108 /DNA_END=1700 /DNA_ORIENTATION=+
MSDDQANPMEPKMGCGIMGRYPVISVMIFAAAGAGLGIGLSYWEPDDPNDKDLAIQWIGLIGDLFIRALKAVVLPLVFVNVILSVVDMLQVGQASSVGGKTVLLYLVTTLIASIVGLIAIVAFESLFTEGDFDDSLPFTIQLGCNMDGYFVTEEEGGSLTCSNEGDEASTVFDITSISTNYATKGGTANDISVSDQIYNGVFTKLVVSNITAAFASANFAGVVFFAIFFGVALHRVMFKKIVEGNVLLTFLQETNFVLLMLINWIIFITPFAVFSLIARAFGGQDDLGSTFGNVAYLVAATLVAMAVHSLVTHFALFGFVTRSNPIKYLKHITPAQMTAFACASSAATIPVTLQSVRNTGVVPDAVSNFVVPLGATINMDGTAIYFPCACIWLAKLNGLDPSVGDYILLIILATVGSAGAAPVPSAGLVLIITAYNTVFGTVGTPDGFEFIFAVDWFMDRWRTTINVTGDACVAGMVAAISNVSAEEEERLKELADDSPAVEKSAGVPVEEALEEPAEISQHPSEQGIDA